MLVDRADAAGGRHVSSVRSTVRQSRLRRRCLAHAGVREEGPFCSEAPAWRSSERAPGGRMHPGVPLIACKADIDMLDLQGYFVACPRPVSSKSWPKRPPWRCSSRDKWERRRWPSRSGASAERRPRSRVAGRLADPEQFLAAHVDKLVFLDELAAGDSHACAALRVGSVERWGDDTSGQAPPFLALSNVVTIAAGFAHSRAVLRDASFTCWGLNRFGQLGD